MKKTILAVMLSIGVVAASFAAATQASAATLTGVTVVRTGVSGTFTWLQCNIPNGAQGILYVIPTGTSQSAMLATALSALAAGKTVRLDANSFAQYQSITGILMENTAAP